MANYLHVLFFALVGGVFSLIGGILLLGQKKSAETLAKYSAPFAAGALLAAAFFDLIKEAGELSELDVVLQWVLVGILLFFMLEHFLHWFHHHHEHADKKMRVAAPLVIIGDTVHNFIDGVAIGAAFLISVPTGIVVSVAVAAHEIPQEIGDFGVLLKGGLSRSKVIKINVISALMSTVGAILTFWLGSQTSIPLAELLAVTAGMFIYIAASDLIPTIHETTGKKPLSHIAAVLLLLGVLTVGLATTTAHDYIESGHSHDSADTENIAADHDHNGKFVIEDHDKLPSLKISISKDSVAGYNLHLEVTNFEFSAEHAGYEAVVGEGHAHVYLNGNRINRLYGHDMYIPELNTDDILRVTLNANDHREISHDGVVIEATLIVGRQSSATDAFYSSPADSTHDHDEHGHTH